MKTKAEVEQILKWLENELNIEGLLTNWHLNDQFLNFHDLFYQEESFNKSRKKFTYYANKLVKKGLLHKAEKTGLGRGSLYEFGCRTQTIWRIVVKVNKNDNITRDKKAFRKKTV